MRIFKTTLLFCVFTFAAVAQTGTYRLYNNGASCTIALTGDHGHVNADIFAWWHTESGRHGVFSGKGEFKNNSCILHSADDADCIVSFSYTSAGLKVQYSNCMSSNLPDDFSGSYKKITNNTPGYYRVVITKAYFYKTVSTKSQLHAYLVKGNKVNVDLENIINGQWVYINYTNPAGKTTSGYMPWQALKADQ